MEMKESYGKPPWIFKGSALYQFHLVKAETARAFIPKEFRLVEAFGYTLGGFFLANYQNSPAGRFDELVVIAGIVWNPPTSCAWAARVLVDSKEACNHGRKEVGLPSQVARFSKKYNRAIPKRKCKGSGGGLGGFLERIGMMCNQNETEKEKEKDSMMSSMELDVSEIQGVNNTGICNISGLQFPMEEEEEEASSSSSSSSNKWMKMKKMGPLIKMSLPSFSGRTEYNPHLLKYSCQIQCRVKPVSPAKVVVSSSEEEIKMEFGNGEEAEEEEARRRRKVLSVSVMLSRPIFALQFNSLKMEVDPPSPILYSN